MNKNFIVGEDDEPTDELTSEIIKIFKDYNVELKPDQIKEDLPKKKKEEEKEQLKNEDDQYGVEYDNDEDEYNDYEDNDDNEDYYDDYNNSDDDGNDIVLKETINNKPNNNSNSKNNNYNIYNYNNNNNKNFYSDNYKNNSISININNNNNNISNDNNNNNKSSKYNSEFSTVKQHENSFNSSVSTILDDSEVVTKFLTSQGILTLGSLAIMEDDSIQVLSYTIECADTEAIKIFQEISRDVIKASQCSTEPRSYINPNFSICQVNHSSSIMVLNGTTLNDEKNLRKLDIHTIGQLASASDRVIISADSRLSLFSFMAKRFLEYIKNKPYAYSPMPLASLSVIKTEDKSKLKSVYYYCSIEVADYIKVQGCIKSAKLLFEEFMNSPKESRFNHPWRKIYFSFRLAASKYCKNLDPTDLDVYSYLLWRSTSSRGLSSDNCVGGVLAIQCFYSPVPPGIDLGVYSKEFEVKIEVDIEDLLKSPTTQVFYCISDNQSSNLLNKDIWIKATKDDLIRESSSDSWKNYVDGSDPKLTTPHCSIITLSDSNLIGAGFAQAAIIGLDGNEWAKSAGFGLKGTEGKTLAGLFSKQDPGAGVSVNGNKYMTLKTDSRSLYGKKGSGGVVCVKTGTCVLIGVYDDKLQPGAAANAVEKLADYLIDNNC
ncbi:hypothetical protein DICPUDRAFT_151634 [Dictyostelium purpureum]|uniref:Profilin n=1 Tax=Dictyostelium purpureum TaxID=5786 RepID=F0ZJC6_DICPU|nr:uncharacterized protein DICPUDRAFT_151634 [Dictyostelium purpureum]EGC35955.1 hypothetical protein DICPUDRAFT_151634 [Dictyostelium purpureum]|eukprot:XP_003287528.1 hypothetical protein DICPUDRAFT_151634 [Dictyostelium purpureum]